MLQHFEDIVDNDLNAEPLSAATTAIVVTASLRPLSENRIPSLGIDWAGRRKFIEQIVRERITLGKMFRISSG